MLVIGGANTVTGAVVGTFLVTIAYESLRGLEARLNAAGLFTEQVVGLTEIVLALAMIVVLVWRPGGLFPSREIGALLARRGAANKDPT
jgi:branched-chain amino acid transport system permease protein